MPAKNTPPADQRPQSEDFIETARALGADESREAFERVFAAVVKPGEVIQKPHLAK